MPAVYKPVIFFLPTVLACGSGFADVIRPASESIEALPGGQISVLWMIESASTPLFGYSLDINLAADQTGDREGLASINPTVSNFFDSKNLITAGGGDRDSTFSVIIPDASGGAFISTNSQDGSTFLAQTGVNDVLAEVVFDISADASGSFIFELGPGSALSDASGFAVPFTSIDLEIVVVPAPAAFGVPCLVLAGLRRRR